MSFEIIEKFTAGDRRYVEVGRGVYDSVINTNVPITDSLKQDTLVFFQPPPFNISDNPNKYSTYTGRIFGERFQAITRDHYRYPSTSPKMVKYIVYEPEKTQNEESPDRFGLKCFDNNGVFFDSGHRYLQIDEVVYYEGTNSFQGSLGVKLTPPKNVYQKDSKLEPYICFTGMKAYGVRRDPAIPKSDYYAMMSIGVQYFPDLAGFGRSFWLDQDTILTRVYSSRNNSYRTDLAGLKLPFLITWA